MGTGGRGYVEGAVKQVQLHSNSESVVHVYLIGQTLKHFVLSVWERSYMVNTLTFTSLILRRVSLEGGW